MRRVAILCNDKRARTSAGKLLDTSRSGSAADAAIAPGDDRALVGRLLLAGLLPLNGQLCLA